MYLNAAWLRRCESYMPSQLYCSVLRTRIHNWTVSAVPVPGANPAGRNTALQLYVRRLDRDDGVAVSFRFRDFVYIIFVFLSLCQFISLLLLLCCDSNTRC
jgi:hypothetical protein